MMDYSDPWLMPRIDTIYLVALLIITEVVNVHWFIRNMLWVMRYLLGIVVYLIIRHVFFVSLYFYRFGKSGLKNWINENYYGDWYFIKGDLGGKLETYAERVNAYKIDLFWLALYFFLGLWLVWRLTHKLAKYTKELKNPPIQILLDSSNRNSDGNK